MNVREMNSGAKRVHSICWTVCLHEAKVNTGSKTNLVELKMSTALTVGHHTFLPATQPQASV
jgi:hypothetical protein